MSRRLYNNPHDLPVRIIKLRLINVDDEADVSTYSFNNIATESETFYASIESIASDSQIETALSTAITAQEQAYLLEFAADKAQIRSEYISTITQLQNIESTTSPTNAQVIAAVKYLARTIRLMLKILARIYNQ